MARGGGGARAGVLIVHGFGEHGGRYGHVAERLVREGFEVTDYDMRGHGESDGVRGDFAHYGALQEDLAAMVALAGGTVPRLFLYAHSFGAQMAIRQIQQGETRVSGAVFSAPWLRLAIRPPAWKLAVARVAARWAPALRMRTGVGGEMLSRDPGFLAGLDPKGLRHRWISVRAFWQIVTEAEAALREATRFQAPFLLGHGAKDRLMAPEGSAEFFRTAGSTDREEEIFAEGFHETHNDLQREEWLECIVRWLAVRCRAEEAPMQR